MGLMKKGSLVALCALGIRLFSLNGEEPICHHCEEIREYNAEHHQNFEYFDDYLKGSQSESDESSAYRDPKIQKPINIPPFYTEV
jgi:hypothetical protein